jgi:hypothetical protein
MLTLTSDFSNFNPSQDGATVPPMIGDGIGQKFVFGPEFYEGFNNWPNTQWIYDIPFAQKNHTDSVYEATYALKGIGDKLFALEVGNEPDLYMNQGVRNSPYGPAQYASEWDEYVSFLTRNLSLPTGPMFQTLTLASVANNKWTAYVCFLVLLQLN